MTTHLRVDYKGLITIFCLLFLLLQILELYISELKYKLKLLVTLYFYNTCYTIYNKTNPIKKKDGDGDSITNNSSSS